MATEFKKLSEVNIIEEPKDTAYALIEQDGEIYRTSKVKANGAGEVKTAIIRANDYLDWLDYMLNYRPQPKLAESYTPSFECINMTFEEAWEIVSAGQPLQAVALMAEVGSTPAVVVCPAGEGLAGQNTIVLSFVGKATFGQLMWTVNGIEVDYGTPE